MAAPARQYALMTVPTIGWTPKDRVANHPFTCGFPVSRYPKESRIVLRALQRYGMIVADNGSNWFVSGAPNRGWNNDDLHQLGRVHGSDFEVVDTASLPRP